MDTPFVDTPFGPHRLQLTNFHSGYETADVLKGPKPRNILSCAVRFLSVCKRCFWSL